MNWLDKLRECLRQLRPLRFAKYQPARRTGTRRVERRLLRRLKLGKIETAS